MGLQSLSTRNRIKEPVKLPSLLRVNSFYNARKFTQLKLLINFLSLVSSFLSQKPVIFRVITTSWQFIDFTLRISLPPTCATRVTVRLRFVFPGFNVFSAFTFSPRFALRI